MQPGRLLATGLLIIIWDLDDVAKFNHAISVNANSLQIPSIYCECSLSETIMIYNVLISEFYDRLS